MTCPGHVANNPEWVELDLEGKLVGRWKLGPQVTGDPVTHSMTHALEGFAFTEDGRLFAQTLSCPELNQCSYRLELLDRTTSTWKAAADNPINPSRYLLGADGNDVVLWDRSQLGGVHLLWVQPSELH